MVKNKRAWLRIMEAIIAIMILSSVILVVYSKQAERIDASNAIYTIQKQILSEIAFDNTLRGYVLEGKETELQTYVNTQVPPYLNSSIRVCDLTDPPTPCKLTEEVFLTITDKNIFAEETIISSDLDTYDPKKVVLYIWENN